MKVLSWNVNSINARLERALACLEKHQPDVACFQELKCSSDKFPFEPFRIRGWECEVLGQKTYNGVAVLTRQKTESRSLPLSGNPLGDEARAIGVKVAGIWVYSLYVPNGQEVGSLKYDFKLKWLEAIRDSLLKRHSPEEEVLLCGDFNIAPSELDLHDPEKWRDRVLFSEPERRWMASMLESYRDTYRMHFPTEIAFTWWDYRELGFPLNKGLRIDLILASPRLARRCKSASIDRDERKGTKPSDHAPIFVELE